MRFYSPGALNYILSKGRALARTVNADERIHIERDDSQRVEPALEDRGEDDVEKHRELKFWASRESGQRLSDCTIDAEEAQH